MKKLSEAAAYLPSRRDKARTRDRGWILASDLPRSPKADAVAADLLDRLAQHAAEDTLPRGPRGLFYDLRPAGIQGNPRGVIYTKRPQTRGRNSMEATPEYVSDLLSKMRRVWDSQNGWLVPEDWISDGRAPDPITPNETPNAAFAADAVGRYIADLRLARQAGQPLFLELRCESQDLMARIARVAVPYGVTVPSGSGMDGLKSKKHAAERASAREVPTLIGHLADLDTAGGDIADAFAEDAVAFTQWHRSQGAPGSLFVKRIGLTRAQALKYDLLDADGKAELDGLPVPVLDALVCKFIESHLDPAIQRAVVQVDAEMRAEVVRLISGTQLGVIEESDRIDSPDISEDWA
jgi:hypothetical protein